MLLEELLANRLDELSKEHLLKYYQKSFDDFNDRSPEAKARKAKRSRGLTLANKALEKKKHQGMVDTGNNVGARRSEWD